MGILQTGDVFFGTPGIYTGWSKKKGPLLKNCRGPSKIMQIELDLVVLFPTYIGIIMQIFPSLYKLFCRYWMGKFNVAIFEVNTNDKYCQKLTSWLSQVFDHKMRTKNDWKAV